MAVGAWEGLPGAVFTPGAAAAGFLSPLAGAVAVLGLTFCNQRVDRMILAVLPFCAEQCSIQGLGTPIRMKVIQMKEQGLIYGCLLQL